MVVPNWFPIGPACFLVRIPSTFEYPHLSNTLNVFDLLPAAFCLQAATCFLLIATCSLLIAAATAGQPPLLPLPLTLPVYVFSYLLQPERVFTFWSCCCRC